MIGRYQASASRASPLADERGSEPVTTGRMKLLKHRSPGARIAGYER
ncbi:MAG TPA: hypothetical protein VJ810_26225 [Blastocatellia bacterium]|nr:hypothetical protein [Blastocatellia bacterium]